MLGPQSLGRARYSAIAGVGVIGLMLVARPGDAAGFEHVRSEQPSIRALLRVGYERSATLRSLVDEIDRLPGIVYICETPVLSQHMDAALLHMMSGSPKLPILRVLIKSSLAGDYAIAVLAHELQHVAEALRARPATSAAMAAIFARLDGHTSFSKFETEDARLVAADVRRELWEAPRPSRPRLD